MKAPIILFFCLVLSSCKKDSCFNGKGKQTSELRSFNDVRKITVYDGINVILEKGTKREIILKGGKNQLPQVKTEVKDGYLQISDGNSCNWSRSYDNPITVTVRSPDIYEILSYGYGSIISQGILSFDSMNVRQYGNGKMNLNVNVSRIFIDQDVLGDVEISGTAFLTADLQQGTGTTDLRNLKSKIHYIRQYGQGDVYITADSILEVTIKNDGNVYYSGNPSLILRREGNGLLIKN